MNCNRLQRRQYVTVNRDPHHGHPNDENCCNRLQELSTVVKSWRIQVTIHRWGRSTARSKEWATLGSLIGPGLLNHVVEPDSMTTGTMKPWRSVTGLQPRQDDRWRPARHISRGSVMALDGPL